MDTRSQIHALGIQQLRDAKTSPNNRTEEAVHRCRQCWSSRLLSENRLQTCLCSLQTHMSLLDLSSACTREHENDLFLKQTSKMPAHMTIARAWKRRCLADSRGAYARARGSALRPDAWDVHFLCACRDRFDPIHPRREGAGTRQPETESPLSLRQTGNPSSLKLWSFEQLEVAGHRFPSASLLPAWQRLWLK